MHGRGRAPAQAASAWQDRIIRALRRLDVTIRQERIVCIAIVGVGGMPVARESVG